MTAEQEAFERGFLRGFQEGLKASTKQYQNVLPQPGIIWTGGMPGPAAVGTGVRDVNYNTNRLQSE